MKKPTRKRVIISVIVIAVVLASILVIARVNHLSKCRDIIGDGYAMGTDPEPVVIGNTCDV